MNHWRPDSVLAVSPHADDIELGAGGTIHKWIKKGTVVHSIIFSTLKMPERETEIEKAHGCLGIRSITIYDFQNRTFDQERQDILQILWDLNENLKPDVVLVPCSQDIHQDHRVVYEEARRAFKTRTLLGYEDPWNMYGSDLRMMVEITEADMEAKCNAAFSYKTQKDRYYMDKDFVIALAKMRGIMINVSFAESFEIVRMRA